MKKECDLMVLNAIKRLEDLTGHGPCKKTVQKIIYLMEEAGKDPEFSYTIHFYGPYSAELDYEIQNLTLEGYLDIEYTNFGHFLSVSSDTFPSQTKTDEIEKNVIDWFGKKSASDLELLATTLYVQRMVGNTDMKQVISGVKKIKGSKYTDEQIDDAIEDLTGHNYF